jgi:hypothetical protein
MSSFKIQTRAVFISLTFPSLFYTCDTTPAAAVSLLRICQNSREPYEPASVWLSIAQW